MEFKIDTKTSYTIVKPLTDRINAALTEAIRQKQAELGQSVSQNLIVDLSGCSIYDDTTLPALMVLHEDFYSNNHSLVFTGMAEDIAQQLQTDKEEQSINIAPTMAEAIDIISMDILERDLFNEE